MQERRSKETAPARLARISKMRTENMRAYLINPFNRTVTQGDIEEDDIGELLGLGYEAPRPGLGAVELLPANEDGGSGDWLTHYLYVPPEFSFEQYDDMPGTISDHRKIKGDPRDWFQIMESIVDPRQPASFPYPCLGLVIGLDCDGAWCSAGLRPAELHKRVKFFRGKLVGYAASTTIEKDLVWTGPVVEPIGEPGNVVRLRKVA
jgi:hypothetical protein